jgi:putative transcriptional regulator
MAEKMTPSFLIAPPWLTNELFQESVIILAGHQKNGSLGFILNRPIGIAIKDLMELKVKCDPILTERPVLFGGPVEKNSGFIMYEHSSKKPLAPGFMLSTTLSISPARKLLEEGVLGRLPGRFELLLGYASWTKGQLQKELSEGAWLHAPFTKKLLFDIPHEDRWQSSFDMLGVRPYNFMYVPGGAQA